MAGIALVKAAAVSVPDRFWETSTNILTPALATANRSKKRLAMRSSLVSTTPTPLANGRQPVYVFGVFGKVAVVEFDRVALGSEHGGQLFAQAAVDEKCGGLR